MVGTGAADDADVALLLAAAEEAGALALGFFGRQQRTWAKGETSIVGEADFAVDLRLTEILRRARPDYGWLSEETADNPERLGHERVFIVDPIDGTRGFLAGSRQWTISLAVVEAGRPVAAVLAAPALGQTFQATAGGGVTRNGLPLSSSRETDLRAARFAASRRYARAVTRAGGEPAGARYVPSLAYRLALVASGEVEVVIAKAGAMDWDLAAADLLVQEAGARLTDLAGEGVRYNRAIPVHPPLVATTPALFADVAELVREVDRQDG